MQLLTTILLTTSSAIFTGETIDVPGVHGLLGWAEIIWRRVLDDYSAYMLSHRHQLQVIKTCLLMNSSNDSLVMLIKLPLYV